jgi:hypothetical protein
MRRVFLGISNLSFSNNGIVICNTWKVDMAKKKKKNLEMNIKGDHIKGDKRVIHSVGGSYIEGDISVKGGDVIMGDKTTIDESRLTQTIFQPFYYLVENRPNTSEVDREKIKAVLKDIQKETQKGDAARSGFLQEFLQNLKSMAEDIWEVVTVTLANPVAGLSTVVSKVAKKMVESTKQGEKCKRVSTFNCNNDV